MLDTILTYDATGGGTQAVVPPTSLTIKENGHLVGYFADGISCEDITITNANNTDWPSTGFKLPATSDGTAVGTGDPFRWFTHRIPVKKSDVLTVVSTSGANPVHAGIYVLYPKGLGFKPRSVLEGDGYLLTKGTTAAGTNCAAGTIVQGATNVTGFDSAKTYTPVQIKANAAFTTTAFLGLKKLSGDNVMFIAPVGLTDVANDMKATLLPHGLFTVSGSDAIEIFWSSVTAEQPTADITFVY